MNLRSLSCFCVCLVLCFFAPVADAQESLVMPPEVEIADSVKRASLWLVEHLKSGSIEIDGQAKDISVIAWKDPTLRTFDDKTLAGYLITDTLWSSYALSLEHPLEAGKLTDSLRALGCEGNSLHEVVWRKIETIQHRIIDDDIVHGKSFGLLMSKGNLDVDVRSFTTAFDSEFAIGHPHLFAEHAVYQALFEFRTGNKENAKSRIRAIFSRSQTNKSPIRWSEEPGVLTDFVTDKDLEAFLGKKASTIRQYSFKLALIGFAVRKLGLEREFNKELVQIELLLRKAQNPDGGIPHFFDMDHQGTCTSAPNATGEATAIYILMQALDATSP